MRFIAHLPAPFRKSSFALLAFAFHSLFPVPSVAAAPESAALQPVAAPGLRPRKHSVKPAHSVIPPGFDWQRVEVKFQDGLKPDIAGIGNQVGSHQLGLASTRAATVLRSISDAGGRWRPASSMDRTHLQQLRSRAQLALGREIADLSSYFILTLPSGADPKAVMDALNDLPEVELASAATLSAPAPSVPDFEPLQAYLSPAPDGLVECSPLR